MPKKQQESPANDLMDSGKKTAGATAGAAVGGPAGAVAGQMAASSAPNPTEAAPQASSGQPKMYNSGAGFGNPYQAEAQNYNNFNNNLGEEPSPAPTPKPKPGAEPKKGKKPGEEEKESPKDTSGFNADYGQKMAEDSKDFSDKLYGGLKQKGLDMASAGMGKALGAVSSMMKSPSPSQATPGASAEKMTSQIPGATGTGAGADSTPSQENDMTPDGP